MLPSSLPRILLSVPHFLQQYEADCLAACALMMLTYQGYTIRYRRLLHILGTQPYGTPFSNLKELEQLGIQVAITSGSLTLIYDELHQNRPSITPVQTSELPHWEQAVDHAVVVVGMDGSYVYINDPAFETAPIAVSLGDFDLARLEKDEDFAVFR